MACLEGWMINRPFKYKPIDTNISKNVAEKCLCGGNLRSNGTCLNCARNNKISLREMNMHKGLFNMRVYKFDACTYYIYGSKPKLQHWYHCNTCYYGRQNLGVCYNCAKNCKEKKHCLSDMKYGLFFCDTGEDAVKQRQNEDKKCVVM